MKKVFAAGSFALLHPGHLYFLEEAKKLGTHLTVVIASDASMERKLGFVPVPAAARRRLIAGLGCVDEALIGNSGDIFSVLRKVRPDVIALGHDQQVDIARLKNRLAAYAISAEIRRIPKLDSYSSRKLVRTITAYFCRSKKNR